MSLYKGDKSAAFVGLIGGAVTILLLVYGMVLLTNASFAGHHEPAPPAAPGAAPAPAQGAPAAPAAGQGH